MGVLVAVTLALIAIVACGSAAEQEATVAPAATEAPAAASTGDESSADAESEAPSAMFAPTFELPNAKGETVSLASYAGEKNVVLVFYRGFW